jgi:hypothetical protein
MMNVGEGLRQAALPEQSLGLGQLAIHDFQRIAHQIKPQWSAMSLL